MVKPQVYGCIGGIPVKDQPGAKFFQDGFGVNMMGDIAVESNIYYIPRMDDESFQAAFSTRIGGQASGRSWFCDTDPRAAYLKSIGEKLRRGEEIYSIARKPGIPLSGGTVWTYTSNGELGKECAVIAASLIVGLQMDEDGYVYFSNERPRVRNEKPFLLDSGSNYGTNAVIDRENKTPKTSTFMKTKAGNVRWMLKNALIPADPLPDRPHDLGGECWVEGGVEWMYAGLSPNAGFGGCTCPATRFHLDWFKRSYIPEGYRRSIGILDTNGNLIMHLGRYGNYDDLLRMKPGSEDIALTLARFISGTDNYLAFDDWGEGLIVLKLNYHAEETAGIGEVMSAK
jgi:hypothetical protein